MKITKLHAVLAAILCLSAGVCSADQEISGRDVPAVIRAAFAKAYPTAKVLKWEKESLNGSPVFEAESTDGKINRNVMYSPDGKVAQIEETMAVADLPGTITDAVQKDDAKAVITSAVKITQGDSVQYKLSLKNTAKKRIAMRTDGSIVK